MEQKSLGERVETLEKMVIGLQDLPDRMTAVERRLTSVESQIVQLAKRMDDGFSATKAEMHKLNDETKAEMRKLNADTMAQARMLYEDLKETIKKIGEGPGGKPN